MSSLSPSTQSREAAWVIKFQGQALDEHTVRYASEHLLPLTNESGRHAVELDLGDVDRVTAGGVAGLMALRRQLLADGVALTLGNAKRQVYNVFELTRLTRALDVRPRRASPFRPQPLPVLPLEKSPG